MAALPRMGTSPLHKGDGGGGGYRPRVQGFAGPCLSHSATPPQERASPAACVPGVQYAHQGAASPRLRADDGIRTRDPHLGKVMLYQLSHVRMPPLCTFRGGSSPSRFRMSLATLRTVLDPGVTANSNRLDRGIRENKVACVTPRDWGGQAE